MHKGSSCAGPLFLCPNPRYYYPREAQQLTQPPQVPGKDNVISITHPQYSRRFLVQASSADDAAAWAAALKEAAAAASPPPAEVPGQELSEGAKAIAQEKAAVAAASKDDEQPKDAPASESVELSAPDLSSAVVSGVMGKVRGR